MSGLLRRLARQTLGGDEPLIHPVARIPYGPPAELIEANNGLDPGFGATPMPSSEPQHRVIAPGPTVSRSSRPESSPGPEEEVRSPRPAPAPASMTNRDASLPLERDTRGALPLRAAEPGRRGSEPRLTASDRLPRADAEAPRAHDAVAVPTASRAAPEAKPSDTPPAERSGLSRLPAPLVRFVVPAVSALSPEPAAQPPAPLTLVREEDQAPAEIHVHIDRIEVTALQEAAPSKPAAPQRRKPMSLDEYLTKRRGGAG